MKRRLSIVLIVAIVSLLIVFITPLSFAQEEGTESALQNSGQARVEYTLPYPGILPDSPLYFLKAARDRVVVFFISDPFKKAEFDLLQADKRLSAGIALFEKGKKDLSESTISKGENYFEDGIKNLKEAKKQGRDVGGLLNTMDLSAKKHLEVLSDLKKKTSGEILKKFEVLERRMLEFANEVNGLKPK